MLDILDGNYRPSAGAQKPREVTNIGDIQMFLIHYHLKSLLL